MPPWYEESDMKRARKVLDPQRLSFLDFSGELRNKTYDYIFQSFLSDDDPVKSSADSFNPNAEPLKPKVDSNKSEFGSLDQDRRSWETPSIYRPHTPNPQLRCITSILRLSRRIYSETHAFLHEQPRLLETGDRSGLPVFRHMTQAGHYLYRQTEWHGTRHLGFCELQAMRFQRVAVIIHHFDPDSSIGWISRDFNQGQLQNIKEDLGRVFRVLKMGQALKWLCFNIRRAKWNEVIPEPASRILSKMMTMLAPVVTFDAKVEVWAEKIRDDDGIALEPLIPCFNEARARFLQRSKTRCLDLDLFLDNLVLVRTLV